MRRIYVAGPMRGVPDYNFPAFDAARDALQAQGWRVVSPADLDRANSFDVCDTVDDAFIHAAMRRDLVALASCDAIFLLDGWERSEGATVELTAAKAMGLDVLREAGAHDPDRPVVAVSSESVCAEADRIVNGPRREAYGHPLDDYERTAAMWSGYLGHEVTPEQAVAMMVLLKVSREAHRPGRDNRVDMCGYATCLDLIASERARRAETPAP